MQKLKKGLALVLALCLCLSLMSVGVFAETEDEDAALISEETEDADAEVIEESGTAQDAAEEEADKSEESGAVEETVEETEAPEETIGDAEEAAEETEDEQPAEETEETEDADAEEETDAEEAEADETDVEAEAEEAARLAAETEAKAAAEEATRLEAERLAALAELRWPQDADLTISRNVGDYTVTVDVPEGAFAREVYFRVLVVEWSELDDETAALLKSEGLTEDDALLDIGFEDEYGNEIEPDLPITVSITAREAEIAEVYHVEDEETVTLVAEDVEDVAEFEVGGFSYFIIKASYTDGSTAVINGYTAYSSLKKAIDAASDGDVLYLMENVELETITIDKALIISGNSGYKLTLTGDVTCSKYVMFMGPLTIDLNGHTLSSSAAYAFYINGTLTIDGTKAGSKVESSYNGPGVVFYVYNGKSLTLNGGEYTSSSYLIYQQGTSGAAANVIAGGKTITLTDVKATTNYGFLYYESSTDYQYGKLTVTGGTYECKGAYNGKSSPTGFRLFGMDAEFDGVTITMAAGPCVYVLGASDIYANGGYKTTAVVFKGNNVFKVEDKTNDYLNSALAISDDAYSVTVENGEYSGVYGAYVYSSGGDLTISGGKFTGTAGALRVDMDAKFYNEHKWTANATVTGGTFTGAVATNGNEYATIALKGGTFSDLSAVKYAAEDATITIDLGGKTLTLTDAITVNGGNVTIQNGTISTSATDVFTAKAGTLTLGKDLTVNGSSSIIYTTGNGTVTIDGASVTATGTQYTPYYADGGLIEVKSGTLTTTQDIVALHVEKSGKATISGGTVSTKAMTAIKASSGGEITVSGGTVSNVSDYYVAAWAANGGTIKVTGGTITATQHTALCATAGGTVSVSGGTLTTASNKWAVFVHKDDNANAAASSATITGGTFTGYIGAKDAATVTISGGTFNGGVQTMNGGAITITGGTVTGSLYVNTTTGGSITVSGGTFNTQPNASYLAANHCVKANNNDTYTVGAYNLTKTDAVAATCTAPGNSGYWTCATCGKHFSDAAHTTETTIEAVTIAATGHTLTKTDAVAATCTTAGNIDYWTCSVCGKLFSNAEATTEITQEQTVVTALGHSWGAPTYTWADDNSSVTATRVCSRDDTHTETETVNTTSVTTNATYNAPGSIVYTATFSNAAFAAQTKTVAIPQLVDISGDDGSDYIAPSAPSDTTNNTNSNTTTTEDETVEIEDEATPLAALPDSFDEVTVTIGDEEVPLVELPLVYSDVAVESWARDAIAYVTATGIMNGTGDGDFSPTATTTGDMLAVMVYRLSGGETTQGAGWAESGLAWLEDSGLAEGIAYDPNEAATREQLVTILYRMAEAEGYDVSARADLGEFTDANGLSEFAGDAMAWAVSIGLIKGMGDGTINGTGAVTREQIATIFMRYALLLGK